MVVVGGIGVRLQGKLRSTAVSELPRNPGFRGTSAQEGLRAWQEGGRSLRRPAERSLPLAPVCRCRPPVAEREPFP